MHGPPCKHLFAGGAVLSRGHRCQPSAPACNMSSSALGTTLREPMYARVLAHKPKAGACQTCQHLQSCLVSAHSCTPTGLLMLNQREAV